MKLVQTKILMNDMKLELGESFTSSLIMDLELCTVDANAGCWKDES